MLAFPGRCPGLAYGSPLGCKEEEKTAFLWQPVGLQRRRENSILMAARWAAKKKRKQHSYDRPLGSKEEEKTGRRESGII